MVGIIDHRDELVGFIDGNWDCDRNIDVECNLNQGNYIIAVEAEWNL